MDAARYRWPASGPPSRCAKDGRAAESRAGAARRCWLAGGPRKEARDDAGHRGAGLTKRYGGQAVVDGISFHVEEGEIFGILGRTARARPPRWSAWRACGKCDGARSGPRAGPEDRRSPAAPADGVQLQETQLQDKLKVREALELYASFYPDPADWRELLDRWGWRQEPSPGSAGCPAARSSGCSSRSPWSGTRRWCSSTSSPRVWTREPGAPPGT